MGEVRNNQEQGALKLMMNQIQSFLADIRSAYGKQGQAARILIPALFLFVSCCLCSLTISLLRPRASAEVVPSPVVSATGGELTPTPLFGFDLATFTPFPTSTAFVPTPFPTWTPLPTGSPTPTSPSSTPLVPTFTLTAIPSATLVPSATNPPPTATPASPVVIIGLNKRDEYAEIQNISDAEVNLRDWRLVSETGDQSCDLRGTLEPGEVLRIWSRRGNPGFDCRFSGNVWRDNEPDAAVLYNPAGEEVSRFP